MKGAIYYEAIATVIFSHVKISSFRAKAHLVFHWCLYNKLEYCNRLYVITISFIIIIINWYLLTFLTILYSNQVPAAGDDLEVSYSLLQIKLIE